MNSKVSKELLKIARLLISKNQVEEAMDAYSEDYSKRKLNWLSDFTTASDVIEMIDSALSKGYNDFKPKRVAPLISHYNSYKWAFGREYSPVLYIRGVKTKSEAEDILNIFASKGKADEHWIKIDNKYFKPKNKEWDSLPEELPVDNELRIWWD